MKKMKKSLKQFIFKEMKIKGYVLDQEVFNFLGKEPNFSTVELYKDEYRRFEFLKKRFEEFVKDPTAEIEKCGRWHSLTSAEMKKEHRIYKIPKTYFEYLKKLGVKVI